MGGYLLAFWSRILVLCCKLCMHLLVRSRSRLLGHFLWVRIGGSLLLRLWRLCWLRCLQACSLWGLFFVSFSTSRRRCIPAPAGRLYFSLIKYIALLTSPGSGVLRTHVSISVFSMPARWAMAKSSSTT